MNAVEIFIEEVYSVTPNGYYRNGEPMLKVSMRVNDCGRRKVTEKSFSQSEWANICTLGYYMG